EEGTRAGVPPSCRFDRALQFAVDVGIVEHRLGVDGNIVVDDEFQARKTNAGIGDLSEVEGKLRVAHVHHYLQADIGHLSPAYFFGFGFDQTVIDAAFVSLGAGHSHFAAVLQDVRRVSATHDCGNAQLTRNDGRVAGTAAAVGDDGGSQLHDRLPVGVGHVGDENVAGLHLVHFRGVGHHAHLAGADLLADGAARDQHFAGGLQAVAFLYVVAALLRLHRLGAGLKDVDLAVDAVTAPLDVHRAAVVLFNDDGIARQF